MYKTGDYIEHLSEGKTSHVLSISAGRSTVFRPAEPLSDHQKACLAFLQRVGQITISGGDKKEFQIAVQLHAAVDDPDSTATQFTISRTVDDFAALQRTVQGASSHHPALSPIYHVELCALCEHLKKLEALPIKTKHRLVYSTAMLHEVLATGLRRIVLGALVAPTNAELYCEGFERVPSCVASFLLRGVDQTKL